MAEIPHGSEATSIMTPGAGPHQTVLPVGHVSDPSKLPSLEAKNVPGNVPAFWADAGRIIADVLELYSKEPDVAIEIWKFAKSKLGKD